MAEPHDLTAAYALDALDPAEEREYESHLATCERCRDELAALRDATASLAYAAPAPVPPPALRERILEQAHSERAPVIQLRPRRRFTYALTAAAAAAACLAIGLGIWAATLNDRLNRQQAIGTILAEGKRVPLQGANGQLVVTDSGDAVVVVSRIDPAPQGKTYELWVIQGAQAQRAGLFEGGAGNHVVRLARPVPAQATVAATVEVDGGVDAPTSKPIFSAGA
jgi:anti-sigma-K factor RskA